MSSIIHEFEIVTQNKNVRSDCRAIMFVNKGTSTVTINGVYTIAPGEAPLSLNADHPDIDVTNYRIKFNDIGTKNLIIIRQLTHRGNN